VASTKINAPKGFKQVDNSLGGFWKPTKAGQHLQGLVGHLIEAKSSVRDGKPNRFYAIRLIGADSGPIVNTDDKEIPAEDGMLVGVGGAVLLNFLHERIGKEVYLAYRGLGKAKKGQNAPKMYDTFEREFDAETGEVG
jgi:hypothetical protein